MRMAFCGWALLAARREAVLVPLAFLLVSACFLWPPLLAGPGHVFVANDVAYQLDLAFRPPGAGAPRNYQLGDLPNFYYPYIATALQQLGQGHLPLWNPLILGGAPLFGAGQAALLDPINLITRPFGLDLSWVLGAWLRLALAGLGTYGLLRALGRGPLAGGAAGIIFMLCGFNAAWLNYNVFTAVAWLPLILWTTLRLAQTGRAAWLGLLGFALGAQFFAGHPESSFMIGVTWGAYVLFLVAQTYRQEGRRPAGRRLGQYAGALVLALALSLVQTLPMLDMTLQSATLAARDARVLHLALFEPRAWLATLSLLTTTFLPNFFGTPTETFAPNLNNPLAATNYWQPLGDIPGLVSYCGLLALGLAGYGLWHWRHPQRVFFAGAGLLAWALLIRVPGLADFVNALPGFHQGTNIRWAPVFSLGVAVCAGCGLELLLAAPARHLRRVAGAGLAVFGGLLAAVLGVYGALRFGGWQPAWAAQLPPARLVDLFSPGHGTLYWPFLFALLGVGVVAALAGRGPRGTRYPRPVAAVVLLALLAGDLITFGSPFNPVIPVAQNIPPTALTDWLAAHLGSDRMLSPKYILHPNLPLVYGLRDIRGYEDLLSQAFARTFVPMPVPLVGATGDMPGRFSTGGLHRLDLAAVRYLLATGPLTAVPRPGAFPQRAQFGGVKVYENPEALPRAYGVYAAEFLPTADAILARLDSGTFDPHRTVLLDGRAAGPPRPPPAAPPPTVRFTADAAAHVTLLATFAQPGYLVLADSWDPYWQARVDGVPTAILRANGVFRALALAPGAHTVAFDYQPVPVYVGAVVSLAALLSLAGLGIWDRRAARAGRHRRSADARSGA